MADETTTAVVETPVTPAAEPVVTTPEPAAAVPAAEPKLTGEEAIKAAVGKVMDNTKGFELTKPADPKPAEPAKPVVEAPKTEEPKPGEAPKVEEPKVVAEPDPVNLEQWTKTLTENPEIASKLEEVSPGITDQISDWGRKAAMVDGYIEAGLPTPESAKFAAENAENFYKIEETFTKVNSPESLDDFVMNTMVPLSYIKDDQGQPLKNADGTFQTDGSTARFFSQWNAFDAIQTIQNLDQQIAQARKMPGEEGETLTAELERIKEAQTLIQNFKENGYQIPKGKDSTYQRSPEDQALIDKANRDRQEADRITQEANKTAEAAYTEGVMTETLTATAAYLKDVLERTSLSDTEKALVAEKIQAATWDAMGNNRHFQSQKQHLYSLGNKPENKARLVQLAKTTFEQLSRKPFQELVTKYGGKQIAASKSRQQKIDTQISKDRMNQGGGTTPGAVAPSTMTTQQVRSQAIENLKAAGNSNPEDGEILNEVMKLRRQNVA